MQKTSLTVSLPSLKRASLPRSFRPYASYPGSGNFIFEACLASGDRLDRERGGADEALPPPINLLVHAFAAFRVTAFFQASPHLSFG